MVKNMLAEVYELFMADEVLKKVCIKSFERPESLSARETSIVIKPVSAPIQTALGSDTSLAKRFIYQINIESVDPVECKELQARVEKLMESKGFYQSQNAVDNLDDYLADIKRYVDVRTYKGRSRLYEEY